MSKGGTQTTTQNVDPRTQQYVDQMRQYALGSAGTPGQLPPELVRAQQQYGQYANAGNLGLGALRGDASAIGSMMNPYNQTLNPFWQQLREQTLGTIGDQATQAGAFGGSRHGVAEGVGLSGIADAQAMQRYGEFENAMSRAGGLANLGFGAIGAGAFLPQMYHQGQLGLLNQGIGPYGQTQSTPTQGGGLGGLLGGALSLASLIPGPWQIPAAAAGGAKNLMGVAK